MEAIQEITPLSQNHVETIGGARYEVNSIYVGEIPFLDLLKQMLKRDIERERPEDED
jgi:pyruvate/oxaloacetate carboxyltransferase